MDDKTIYEELKNINEKLTRLDEKLTKYPEYQDKTDRALNLSLKNEEDIKDLQDKNIWITRTISGALITGAIGIVFILIKMSVGIK